MKAFGYMRVSSKGQEDGDGFPRQRAAIEKYAAANDIEIVEWFQDVQTGKDEWQERSGWSAMMAAMNGVRSIIVEKLDRVARVVLVSELIMDDLKKKDVQLLTACGDDTDDDQPERVMMRQILAVFASYERTSIVLKLRASRQRKKASTGKCEGPKHYGNTPIERGYVIRMQINRAFGLSFKEIAARLNADEIPTRNGKQWHAGTIQKILAHESGT